MMYKKFAKRVFRKVKRAAKKRYIKRGGPNVRNIVKDVKMLKSLVNVEKKRVDLTTAIQVFAQTSGAGISGYLCNQVNPIVAQGVTGSTRNGNSIKLVSACIDMQCTQVANTVNDMKVKWYLICRPDNAALYSAANTASAFLEPNPFSTVIDYYSARDPEYFTAFRVIKSGIIDLKQDQITGGQTIVQKKYPLKLNLHMKYNNNASTDTTKNSLYMLFVASGGDTVAATGAQVVYNIRYYYTDN